MPGGQYLFTGLLALNKSLLCLRSVVKLQNLTEYVDFFVFPVDLNVNDFVLFNNPFSLNEGLIGRMIALAGDTAL